MEIRSPSSTLVNHEGTVSLDLLNDVNIIDSFSNPEDDSNDGESMIPLAIDSSPNPNPPSLARRPNIKISTGIFDSPGLTTTTTTCELFQDIDDDNSRSPDSKLVIKVDDDDEDSISIKDTKLFDGSPPGGDDRDSKNSGSNSYTTIYNNVVGASSNGTLAAAGMENSTKRFFQRQLSDYKRFFGLLGTSSRKSAYIKSMNDLISYDEEADMGQENPNQSFGQESPPPLNPSELDDYQNDHNSDFSDSYYPPAVVPPPPSNYANDTSTKNVNEPSAATVEEVDTEAPNFIIQYQQLNKSTRIESRGIEYYNSILDSGANTFRCKYCPKYISIYRTSIKRHLYKKHGVRDDWKEHIEKVVNDASTREFLINSIINGHGNGVNESDSAVLTIKCPYCEFNLPTSNIENVAIMKQHLIDTHKLTIEPAASTISGGTAGATALGVAPSSLRAQMMVPPNPSSCNGNMKHQLTNTELPTSSSHNKILRSSSSSSQNNSTTPKQMASPSSANNQSQFSTNQQLNNHVIPLNSTTTRKCSPPFPQGPDDFPHGVINVDGPLQFKTVAEIFNAITKFSVPNLNPGSLGGPTKINFKCPLCDFVSEYKQSIKRHLDYRHHVRDPPPQPPVPITKIPATAVLTPADLLASSCAAVAAASSLKSISPAVIQAVVSNAQKTQVPSHLNGGSNGVEIVSKFTDNNFNSPATTSNRVNKLLLINNANKVEAEDNVKILQSAIPLPLIPTTPSSLSYNFDEMKGFFNPTPDDYNYLLRRRRQKQQQQQIIISSTSSHSTSTTLSSFPSSATRNGMNNNLNNFIKNGDGELLKLSDRSSHIDNHYNSMMTSNISDTGTRTQAFRCDSCEAFFISGSAYAKHVKSVHGGQFPNNNTNNNNNDINMQSSSSDEFLPSTAAVPLKCPICFDTTGIRDKLDLYTHLKMHHMLRSTPSSTNETMIKVSDSENNNHRSQSTDYVSRTQSPSISVNDGKNSPLINLNSSGSKLFEALVNNNNNGTKKSSQISFSSAILNHLEVAITPDDSKPIISCYKCNFCSFNNTSLQSLFHHQAIKHRINTVDCKNASTTLYTTTSTATLEKSTTLSPEHRSSNDILEYQQKVIGMSLPVDTLSSELFKCQKCTFTHKTRQVVIDHERFSSHHSLPEVMETDVHQSNIDDSSVPLLKKYLQQSGGDHLSSSRSPYSTMYNNTAPSTRSLAVATTYATSTEVAGEPLKILGKATTVALAFAKENEESLIYSRNNGGSSSNKLTIYRCKYCHFCDRSQTNVKEHEKTIHSDLGKLSNPSSDDFKPLNYDVDEADDMDYDYEGEDQLASIVSDTKEGSAESSTFKCRYCPYTHQLQQIVLQHETNKHFKNLQDLLPGGQKFMRCKDCDYIAPSKAHLVKHQIEHNKGSLSCPSCDFTTFYTPNLERHLRRHSQPPLEFGCGRCSYSSSSNQGIILHRERHHHHDDGPTEADLDVGITGAEEIESANMYQEAAVNGNANNIVLHSLFSTSADHNNKEQEVYVGTANGSSSNSPNNNKFNNIVITYRCPFDGCPFSNAMLSALQFHINTEHPAYHFTRCNYCPATILALGEYLTHLLNVHPIGSKLDGFYHFEPHMADATPTEHDTSNSSKPVDLTNNTSTTTTTPFSREDLKSLLKEAFKKTRQVVNSTNSANQRDTSEQFLAEIDSKCDTTTRRNNNNNNNNVNVYARNNTFVGSLNSGLTNRPIYKRVLPHEKDKHCTLCAYSTKWSCDLRLHYRNRHKVSQPYECQDCKQTFAYASDLRTHLKKAHGIDSRTALYEKVYSTFKTGSNSTATSMTSSPNLNNENESSTGTDQNLNDSSSTNTLIMNAILDSSKPATTTTLNLSSLLRRDTREDLKFEILYKRILNTAAAGSSYDNGTNDTNIDNNKNGVLVYGEDKTSNILRRNDNNYAFKGLSELYSTYTGERLLPEPHEAARKEDRLSDLGMEGLESVDESVSTITKVGRRTLRLKTFSSAKKNVNDHHNDFKSNVMQNCSEKQQQPLPQSNTNTNDRDVKNGDYFTGDGGCGYMKDEVEDDDENNSGIGWEDTGASGEGPNDNVLGKRKTWKYSLIDSKKSLSNYKKCRTSLNLANTNGAGGTTLGSRLLSTYFSKHNAAVHDDSKTPSTSSNAEISIPVTTAHFYQNTQEFPVLDNKEDDEAIKLLKRYFNAVNNNQHQMIDENVNSMKLLRSSYSNQNASPASSSVTRSAMPETNLIREHLDAKIAKPVLSPPYITNSISLGYKSTAGSSHTKTQTTPSTSSSAAPAGGDDSSMSLSKFYYYYMKTANKNSQAFSNIMHNLLNNLATNNVKTDSNFLSSLAGLDDDLGILNSDFSASNAIEGINSNNNYTNATTTTTTLIDDHQKFADFTNFKTAALNTTSQSTEHQDSNNNSCSSVNNTYENYLRSIFENLAKKSNNNCTNDISNITNNNYSLNESNKTRVATSHGGGGSSNTSNISNLNCLINSVSTKYNNLDNNHHYVKPLPPPHTSSTGSKSSGSKNVFGCAVCSYVSNCAAKIKLHAAVHASEKLYNCSVCGKRSYWSWDISKHIKAKHPNTPSASIMKSPQALKEIEELNKLPIRVMKREELIYNSANNGGDGFIGASNSYGLYSGCMSTTSNNPSSNNNLIITPYTKSDRNSGHGPSEKVNRALPLTSFEVSSLNNNSNNNQDKTETFETTSEDATGDPSMPKISYFNKPILVFKCILCQNYKNTSRLATEMHVKEFHGYAVACPPQGSSANDILTLDSKAIMPVVDNYYDRVTINAAASNSNGLGDASSNNNSGILGSSSGTALYYQQLQQQQQNITKLTPITSSQSNVDSSNCIVSQDTISNINDKKSNLVTNNLTTTAAGNPRTNVYPCPVCPFISNKQSAYKRHTELHQFPPKMAPNSENTSLSSYSGPFFKCPFCPYFVPLKRMLWQHLRMHVPNPQEVLNRLSAYDPAALQNEQHQKLLLPQLFQESHGNSHNHHNQAFTASTYSLNENINTTTTRATNQKLNNSTASLTDDAVSKYQDYLKTLLKHYSFNQEPTTTVDNNNTPSTSLANSNSNTQNECIETCGEVNTFHPAEINNDAASAAATANQQNDILKYWETNFRAAYTGYYSESQIQFLLNSMGRQSLFAGDGGGCENADYYRSFSNSFFPPQGMLPLNNNTSSSYHKLRMKGSADEDDFNNSSDREDPDDDKESCSLAVKAETCSEVFDKFVQATSSNYDNNNNNNNLSPVAAVDSPAKLNPNPVVTEFKSEDVFNFQESNGANTNNDIAPVPPEISSSSSLPAAYDMPDNIRELIKKNLPPSLSMKSGNSNSSSVATSVPSRFKYNHEYPQPPPFEPPKPSKWEKDGDKEIMAAWGVRDGKYVRMFKCPYCPHLGTRRANVRIHIKLHGNRKGMKGKLQQCPKCSFNCANPTRYANHLTMHGIDLSEHFKSNRQHQYDDSTGRHTLINSDDSPNGDNSSSTLHQDNDESQSSQQCQTVIDPGITCAPPTVFKCSKCPGIFRFHRMYTRHLKFHGKRYKFRCKECDYSSPKIYQLVRHGKVHTEIHVDSAEVNHENDEIFKITETNDQRDEDVIVKEEKEELIETNFEHEDLVNASTNDKYVDTLLL